jgi:hypothetical protein
MARRKAVRRFLRLVLALQVSGRIDVSEPEGDLAEPLGIPRPRRLPLLLGMYTRRSG